MNKLPLFEANDTPNGHDEIHRKLIEHLYSEIQNRTDEFNPVLTKAMFRAEQGDGTYEETIRRVDMGIFQPFILSCNLKCKLEKKMDGSIPWVLLTYNLDYNHAQRQYRDTMKNRADGSNGRSLEFKAVWDNETSTLWSSFTE